jgi:hypothetical protein
MPSNVNKSGAVKSSSSKPAVDHDAVWLELAIRHANESEEDLGPNMRAIRRQARKMLDAVVSDRRATLSLTPDECADGITLSIDRTYRRRIPYLVKVEGSEAVRYAMHTLFSLISEAGARVQRCADPKCAQFFLRKGKMRFHTSRCARRFFMREKRRREREELLAFRAAARRK